MSGKSTQRKNITRQPRRKVEFKTVARWVMLAVICAVFVFNYKAVFDRKLDPNGDNIVYFLLAKALSEGKGYVDIVPPTPTPHTHFPPGYPMFMSVFMRFFPDNIIAMKILNGILFLLSVFLLFRIVRKTTRDNIWLAFIACLVTVSHPSLLRWSVIMMSEPLYILISFGIILISLDLDVERIFKKGPKDLRQVARLVLLCLLVISAYLVRTMGVSVVLAAALAFGVTTLKALVRKGGSWWKPGAVAVAICLSLFVAHEGWSSRNHAVREGFKSDYNAGFMYTFSHERMTPELWKNRIISNFREFSAIWIPRSMIRPKDAMDFNRHTKPTAADWFSGAALIILMCFGIWRLRKGRVLLSLYIVITFSVLLLYQEQYAGERYFIPVLPLMIFAAINGIWELFDLLANKILKNHPAVVPVLAVAAAAALLFIPYKDVRDLYKSATKYRTYVEMDPDSDYAHYIQAAEWLKEKAGDRAVIACRKPEAMFVYSGYKHAVRIPLSGSEEEVIEYLRNSGANCVVLDTWARHAYEVVFPAMRKNESAFPVYFTTKEDKTYGRPTIVTAFLPSKLKAYEK